ncbi:MAG: hypothetical protein NT144_13620 [Bacteroidia bacterium]|nr:hypothetical protein [Bacteroidia bacterium]
MKNISISLILIFLLCSCNRPPRDVRMILNAAGDNRPELEKVIDHYKASGDKDKLKASYFLIGNMDNKFTIDCEEVRKYDPIFAIFDSLQKINMRTSNISPYIRAKWDSLVKANGTPSFQNAKIIPDYLIIKADYLIENIDFSFKLREESKWGKKLSFEQFCESILAYRFRHEPLENWRSEFYEKYKSLIESVNADSIIQLGREIQKNLFSILSFNRVFLSYPFDIPLDKMKTHRYGACPHNAIFTGMVMRSVGLPIAIDYTPLWANSNSNHKWNALFLENGNIIPFNGDNKIFGYVQFKKIAKIYRETFANQNNEMPENNQDVPLALLDNYRIDVTQEYTKTYNIRIPLKYSFTSKKKYAILCTFNNRDWVSQDWGKIEKEQACFKNMGSGVVYLAMYYDGGSIYPASNPFILREEGNIDLVVPLKGKTQDMLLLRKFHNINKPYFDDMINGYFQGANKADFSDSVKLFTVTAIPEKIETAEINNPLKFRYVRYKSPPSKKGNVAELEFYGGRKSSDTLLLHGNVIGFPEKPPTIGTSYRNAFDDNLETYFGGVAKGISWAGIDLGVSKRITKIRYCPRSDTNFILVGDTYELCYWENGEWVSMGEQVAKDQFLVYKNVPAGALYILHNLTRGKEERIFTYEEGKQVFW